MFNKVLSANQHKLVDLCRLYSDGLRLLSLLSEGAVTASELTLRIKRAEVQVMFTIDHENEADRKLE
jgi:hypothetical protein